MNPSNDPAGNGSLEAAPCGAPAVVASSTRLIADVAARTRAVLKRVHHGFGSQTAAGTASTTSS